MKFVSEFRELELAQKLAAKIKEDCTRPWRIMEVCGGQTHAILQYGIQDLLPEKLTILHGPGCPVCVTPCSAIDKAILMAERENVILCSYGDMLRVPGSTVDLLTCRAKGADVRIIYSPLEAVELAKNNPNKNVVFFAIGFETTAPANAMSVLHASSLGLKNYFLFSSHVTVPAVLETILQEDDNRIEAFLGPGHVCSIVGTRDYESIAERFKVPIVIAGFEPVDILDAIYRCVKQLESGEHRVEIQYSRAVKEEGNSTAMNVLEQVFEVSDREWRGLGKIGRSGLRLTQKYRNFDAEEFFQLDVQSTDDASDCISGSILKGISKPTDCPLFAKQCTPENPKGATMVSSEGTCANYFKFRKVEVEV